MIGRKVILQIITRLLSSALAFIALFFISRYFEPDVYGTIIWSLSFVAIFNVISDLGLNSAHVKRVSEGLDINDCLSTFLVGKLFLTGLMAVLVLSSLFVWISLLGNQLPESSMEIVFIFVLFYVMVDLAQIAIMTFDARLQTAKSQLSYFFDPLIRVPFVIIIAVNGLSDVHLAYAYLLGATGFAIASLLILSRDNISWKRPNLFRSYLSFAFPISTIIIMGTLATNVDKLLLGIFWSADMVGFYAMPQGILAIFGIIGAAVTTLAFPAFSKLHSEKNLEAVRKGTVDAERYISMITLPAIIVIVIFPLEVATVLLGPNYADAAGPLRFLSISVFLVLLNGIYSSQINALNRPELNARIVFISLIVVVILLFVLVPENIMGTNLLGMAATGAAIANMSYFVTQFISYRITTQRLTGAGFNTELIKHVLAGIVSGISVIILSQIMVLNSWITLIGYGLGSWAIFAFIIYLLGGLSRKDIAYVMEVINPRKMLRYINDELRGKE